MRLLGPTTKGGKGIGFVGVGRPCAPGRGLTIHRRETSRSALQIREFCGGVESYGARQAQPVGEFEPDETRASSTR